MGKSKELSKLGSADATTLQQLGDVMSLDADDRLTYGRTGSDTDMRFDIDSSVASAAEIEFLRDGVEQGAIEYITDATLADSYLRVKAGSNYGLSLDASGRVTMPYHPYFLASNHGQSKAAGWHQVVFTTSVAHNVGGHYSTSNSRFTAPVAGVYLFSTGGYIPVDNSTERYAFAFRINASSGGDTYIGGGTQADVDAPLSTLTRAIKLNANDYVTVSMYTPYTETIGASFHHMWFNGYLLG